MNPSRRGLLALDFLFGAQGPRALKIDTGRCLAWNRSFCSTCVERCPEDGAVRWVQGRPEIDPDRCTGCGICAEACPAPQNALVAA